jgi:hypothetical protein
MEHLISPLLKPQENNAVADKPLTDDPYAYIKHMDELTRHAYYYINRKIEQNWITERDIELIKFVFVHRWLTLRQIGRLFFVEADPMTTRRRIDRLLKYGLIRRIEWTSYSRPSQNKPSLYELGDSGADILRHKYGMYIGQRDPRTAKPATMLFRMKYIATNELYIQLREAFELVHFEFHPTLIFNEEQVVPTAKYILRNPKGREMPFYLICHREDEKWVKTFRYQARFFKEYISTMEKEATLVVQVSTDDNALLASKIAEQEGAGPITWHVTDKDLYDVNVNLQKGFFIYKNEEKIYYDLR